MKNAILTCILILTTIGIAFSGAENISDNKFIDPAIKSQAEQWMQNQPVRFLENKGQMIDMEGKPVPFVLFKAEAPGMSMYITEKGITYIFLKSEEKEDDYEKNFPSSEKAYSIQKGIKHEEENIKIQWERIDMELQGASIKKENIVKEFPSVTNFNFFFPHCSDGIYGIKEYEKITIKEIYHGIDWVLYTHSLFESGKGDVGGGTGLKYDFIVHPGADPSVIKLIYSSADTLHKKPDGSLELITPYGTLREQAPYSYIKETNREVATQFQITEEPLNSSGGKLAGYQTTVSFSFNTNFPPSGELSGATLIIDPALTWATYYGGNSADGPHSITTDAAGNIFITGYIGSDFFPLLNLAGAYNQPAFAGGVCDAFILKFSNAGLLLWATYYGGSKDEVGKFVSTDGSGNVFVTGGTSSTNFPTKTWAGAYNDNTLGGGFYDAFILRFTNAGLLTWATYYGGSGWEVGYAISTDGGGNMFVTGGTTSTSFPLQNLAGAYNQPANAGNGDVFILKFSNAGSLLWATYYGGSGWDVGKSISADGSGNVFVTGGTSSTNFPLQNLAGAYNQPANAGNGDVFILKLTNAGSLLWATYYGGSGDEEGNSTSADGNGNVFVTGGTSSTNFPLQNLAGAYNQPANAGNGDVFILKITNAGLLLWATYYGGSGLEFFDSNDNIVIDACSNVYVSFTTSSANLPVQSSCDGAYQDNTFNGVYDNAILKFSNTGVRLWATYLGGDRVDFREALAVDGNNNLFVTGEWAQWTSNPNPATYPLTNPGSGAYYAPFNGMDDGYICKFLCAPCDCGGSCGSILTVTANSTNPLCNGQCTGTSTVTPTSGTSPYTYSWSNGQTTSAITGLCSGTYSVLVSDAASGTSTAIITITQPATALTATVTATSAVCGDSSGSATVNVGGGTPSYTYSWNTSPVQSAQTATGLAAGNYTATVTDANGCTVVQIVTITSGSITATATSSTICAGQNATLTASGGTNYLWSNNQTTATITHSPGTTTTYTVLITSGSCSATATATVTVNSGLTVNAGSNTTITQGQSTTLTASGGGTYSWSNGTNGSSITVTPLVTTIYCVTITDANNCTDTACVTVTIEQIDCSNAGELYLPNVFSPNDDGENDVIKIYFGNYVCIKTFQLVIYNRWGEKVFNTNDPVFTWDGFYKGKAMNTSVLVYYMEATLISGEEIIKKGNISLMR